MKNMIDNTLIILFGASEYPKLGLNNSESLKNAAESVNHFFEKKLNKKDVKVLNLFDTDMSFSAIITKMTEFIASNDQKGETQNLIVYYIGHGGFGNNFEDYYLTIKDSDDIDIYQTSFPSKSLAKILKEHTSNFRRFLFLDCCFAAKTINGFQGPLQETVLSKSVENVQKGTAILCAANSNSPALMNEELKSTQFTYSLMQILNNGIEKESEYLSLQKITNHLQSYIKTRFKGESVRPELHDPEQDEGQVSQLSLFPNFATKIVNMEETLETYIFNTFLSESYYFKTPNLSDSILGSFSELYWEFLSSATKLKIQKNDITPDELINYLCEHIINSSTKVPIAIEGYSGTGKSVLITLLYYKIKNILQGKDTVPILIDLMYYERKIYSTTDIEKASVEQLNNHLNKILDFDEIKGKEVILFLVGADEHSKTKVNLFPIIESHPKFYKKVVGVRRVKDKRQYLTKVFKYHTPELEINLSNIITNSDEKVREIVSKYCTIFNYIHSRKDCKEYFIDKISSFNTIELDLFTLRLVGISLLSGYKYKNCTSFCEFIDTYCTEHLNSLDGFSLVEASKMAFQSYHLEKIFEPHEIDNSGWTLISTHESLKSYLIARHVISQIQNPDLENKSFYNFVYPHDVNSYIKQITNSKVISPEFTQQSFFQKIIQLWPNFENKKYFAALTHFTYLMGRFTDYAEKEEAKSFLNELLTENKFIKILAERVEDFQVLDSKYTLPKLHDRQILLLIRTIYISLIYLGDENASEDYIKFCQKNSYLENLNRGFHLEYYGDIQFLPGEAENLLHDDKLRKINLTFTKLSARINGALNKYDKESENYYSMFDVELYTLCSLVQHRFTNEKANLDPYYKNEISNILSSVFNQDLIDNSSSLYSYLSFISELVCGVEKLSLVNAFNLTYFLKVRSRRGWVRKLGLPPQVVEKVSSHTWGAQHIALSFLSDMNPKYNKYKIVKMLHFHDIPEAFTDDLIYGEKQLSDIEKEKELFKFISNFGMIEGFSNMYEIAELGIEFMQKESLESKIANDCDKLDCYLQILNYYIRNKAKSSHVNEFSKNLFKELSPWGKEFFNKFKKLDQYQLKLETKFYTHLEKGLKEPLF